MTGISSAIVTGAASGIGAALARALAVTGTEVVVCDLDFEGAQRITREIVDGGGTAVAAELDVTKAESVRELVRQTEDRTGGLDLMVNNAGLAIAGETVDLSDDDWFSVLDVNLRGVIHGVQAAYPRMVRRKTGHILNIAYVATGT